jgi:putative two-component system response regulator
MDATQNRILIVDDDPLNVRVLVELLRSQFTLSIARDGQETLDLLGRSVLPDLILLDVMMPGMDGYEVCRRIKANPLFGSVPIIFVTALNQTFDETAAFDVGGVDFINKPIVPAVLIARVKTQLALRHSEQRLIQQNTHLDDLVKERTRELAQTQDVMIRALASLCEIRDNETLNHLRRMQHYVAALAHAIEKHPAFAGQVNDLFIERLFRSAPLHDIGKVGLSDAILTKNGPLTLEEQKEMQRHPTIGREAIMKSLASENADEIDFLTVAVDLIGSHHECWDGSGYPDGLSDESIPLAGRLLCVADCYDEAMTEGTYNAPGAHQRAVERIRESAGQRFDPRLVSAFLSVAEEFRLIAEHFPDAIDTNNRVS